jgi:hypothetical protein
MLNGDRIDTLSETLQSITFWATMIEPSGVSLRFLNHDDDHNGKFDNLTDHEKLPDQILGIDFTGETRLGTMLRKKVIRPLQDRAKTAGQEIKPRVIIIITDGAVGCTVSAIRIALNVYTANKGERKRDVRGHIQGKDRCRWPGRQIWACCDYIFGCNGR